MKFTGIFFIGYLVLIIGVLAALWKTGVLQNVGGAWVAIGLVIAIGLGIMIAVSNSGEKKSISIDRT